MRLLTAIATISLAASAAASRLAKRCSPLRDESFYHGYLPPVACWQDQDTACQAYIKEGTELTLAKEHHLAVVYGVSEYCFDDIAEEHARELDGRKIFGWTEKHGTLTPIRDEGILVISNMSDAAVERYEQLRYQRDAPPVVIPPMIEVSD